MIGPFAPSTALWVPVRLISDADFKTEITGTAYGSVTAAYRKAGSDDWTTLAVTAANWDEQSLGDYDLQIPATAFTSTGLWAYRVTVADCLSFVEDVLITEDTVGQGVYTVQLTLEATGGVKVPYCPITVRNSGETAVIAHGVTDPDGIAEFQLDAATYKLRFGPRPGYNHTNITDGEYTGLPLPLVITADTTKTLTTAAHSQYYEGFTYGEMKRAVGRVLRREYGKTIDEDDLGDWVKVGNSAVNGILRWSRYQYETVSVDGQANYTLYQPCKEIEAVTYDDESATGTAPQPLISVTHPEYLRLLAEDSTEGTPSRYSRFGDTIYLWPTPDTSDDDIDVWMLTAPPLLEEDDDVPEYPAEYHRAIVDYALSVAFRDVGMDERSLVYLKTFQAQMQTGFQPALDQGISDMNVEDE